MLNELFAFISVFLAALRDLLFGRSFFALETEIVIQAPKEIVWRALWSCGQLNSTTAVEYSVRQLPDDPQLYHYCYSIEDIKQSSILQVQQMRAGEAFLAQRFREEGEGDPYEFHSHYFGQSLIELEDGETTLLTQHDYIESQNFLDRLVYALEVRFMLSCLKAHCEQAADAAADVRNIDVSVDHEDTLVGGVAGAVVFFGSWYFYDFSWAVFILIVLALYEFGHVLALHILGFRTRDIFIVPFWGCYGLSRVKFRSHFDATFCSLMGAVVSLGPCIALMLGYVLTGEAFLGIGACLFAFISLLHFLPIWPFAGMRIASHIIRSLKEEDVLAFAWTLLIMGVVLSIYLGFVVFALIAGFVAFHIIVVYELQLSDLEHKTDEMIEDNQHLKAMSYSGVAAVLSCVVITLVSYSLVLYVALSDMRVMQFFGLA